MPGTSRAVLISLLASAAPAAELPARIEEPTGYGVFRVDPATGALAPLEEVTSAQQGSRYSYSMYLPGLTSPVAFRIGERHAFAMRIPNPPDLETERAKPHLMLERLAPRKNGRYATKDFVPLDVSAYGEPRQMPGRSGKAVPVQTFLYAPRAPLPPGEYAFSALGLLTPWSGFGALRQAAHAFRIEAGAPTAQPAAAPAQPAQDRAADATADAAVDMRRVRAAAEQGDPRAQLRFGSACASGTGVLQDYVEAYKWLNLAAARLEGEQRRQAAALRDQVSARMTPEQIAEAQRKAREWSEAFEREQP